MSSVSETVGWLLIALAMYVSAAAIVATSLVVARIRRPALRVPKAVLRICTIALSFAIWYAIPMLVHARFGRASH